MGGKMSKIATFILYSSMLKDYVDGIIRQFSQWNEVWATEADFTQKPEHEFRNEGLKQLQEYDYVFCIDADEVILKADQERIVETMHKKKAKVGLCKVLDYVSLNRVIMPQGEHMPIVIVDPKEITFYEIRCAYLKDPVYFNDINIHHLCLTYSQEKLDWKSKNVRGNEDPEKIQKTLKLSSQEIEPPLEVVEILRGGNKK